MPFNVRQDLPGTIGKFLKDREAQAASKVAAGRTEIAGKKVTGADRLDTAYQSARERSWGKKGLDVRLPAARRRIVEAHLFKGRGLPGKPEGREDAAAASWDWP